MAGLNGRTEFQGIAEVSKEEWVRRGSLAAWVDDLCEGSGGVSILGRGWEGIQFSGLLTGMFYGCFGVEGVNGGEIEGEKGKCVSVSLC